MTLQSTDSIPCLDQDNRSEQSDDDWFERFNKEIADLQRKCSTYKDTIRSLNTDYDKLRKEMNAVTDLNQQQAKKIEKFITLLKVLVENENDGVKKAYIQSVLDSL